MGPRTPPDSPLTLDQAMASPLYRTLMAPELGPGEPAFPFDLPLLAGGGRVRLTDFAGERPVALIFGSYT